jgi:hypothetical protein
MLGAGIVGRRVQGRPILWVRSATLRERRSRDPAERLLAVLLRSFAREVDLAAAPNLVDTVGSELD